MASPPCCWTADWCRFKTGRDRGGSGNRQMAQDASRHENLMGRRRRVAGPWATRDDVNPARDRGCAETMSRRRHTRLAAPAVAPGIIGFRLVEGAGGGLAAEHEHPPPKYPRRDATARRGPPRAPPPTTGCGGGRPARPPNARIIAADAAAHGVEASVHRGGRQVVTRRRDIGERRPPVGGRIVDLMCWRVAAAPANAADCMNLATEHGGRERAARRGQGREP